MSVMTSHRVPPGRAAALLLVLTLCFAPGVQAQATPDEPIPGTPPPTATPPPAAAPPAAAAPGQDASYQRLTTLLGELKSADAARRNNAAFQLGQLGDTRAGPALTRAMQGDPSPAVRATSAAALGRLMATPAIPHLQAAATRDPSVHVQAAARDALARMGAAPPMRGYTYRYDQRNVMLQDPDYRSGKSFRTAGISVLSSAGGLGLVLMILAFTAMEDDQDCTYNFNTREYDCVTSDTARNFGIGAGVAAAVALGAGIPLIVVGQKRMSAAEAKKLKKTSRVPRFNVAFSRRGARFTAGWRF